MIVRKNPYNFIYLADVVSLNGNALENKNLFIIDALAPVLNLGGSRRSDRNQPARRVDSQVYGRNFEIGVIGNSDSCPLHNRKKLCREKFYEENGSDKLIAFIFDFQIRIYEAEKCSHVLVIILLFT